MSGFFDDNNVSAAIAQVQQKDGILLVFLGGEGDAIPEVRKHLEDPDFCSMAMSNRVVAIDLRAGKPDFEHFKQMYPVFSLPTVYFIAPSGLVLNCFVGEKSLEDTHAALKSAIDKKNENLSPRTEEVASPSPNVVNAAPPVEVDVADAPEDIPNAAPPDAALSQPCHKDHEQQNGRSSDEKHLPETRQAELQRGTENPGKEETVAMAATQDQTDSLNNAKDVAEVDGACSPAPPKACAVEQPQPDVNAMDIAEAEGACSATSAAAPAAQPPDVTRPDVTKIRVRLLSGETVTHVFGSGSPLQDVRDFIQQHQPDLQYSLLQTFPHKRFTADDDGTSLDALELVPSANLICSPVAQSKPANPPQSDGAGLWGWVSWAGTWANPLNYVPSAPQTQGSPQPQQQQSAPKPATDRPASSQRPQWGARVMRLSDTYDKTDKEKEDFYNGNTTAYQG
uniref:UBX domain-containing protein 2 n=1 Tax=Eutreptiella gymnastica TaxID=73025 RepID=A0A7S4LBS1_9EUGL